MAANPRSVIRQGLDALDHLVDARLVGNPERADQLRREEACVGLPDVGALESMDSVSADILRHLWKRRAGAPQ